MYAIQAIKTLVGQIQKRKDFSFSMINVELLLLPVHFPATLKKCRIYDLFFYMDQVANLQLFKNLIAEHFYSFPALKQG